MDTSGRRTQICALIAGRHKAPSMWCGADRGQRAAAGRDSPGGGRVQLTDVVLWELTQLSEGPERRHVPIVCEAEGEETGDTAAGYETRVEQPGLTERRQWPRGRRAAGYKGHPPPLPASLESAARISHWQASTEIHCTHPLHTPTGFTLNHVIISVCNVQYCKVLCQSKSGLCRYSTRID